MLVTEENVSNASQSGRHIRPFQVKAARMQVNISGLCGLGAAFYNYSMRSGDKVPLHHAKSRHRDRTSSIQNRPGSCRVEEDVLPYPLQL